MDPLLLKIISLVVAVVPLVPSTVALTQRFKTISGTSDARIIQGVAMLIGLLLGGGYMYAATQPADFVAWLLLVLYGLTLGVAASGAFEVVQAIAPAVATHVADVLAPKLAVLQVTTLPAGTLITAPAPALGPALDETFKPSLTGIGSMKSPGPPAA